jgi:hypothetical protein
MSKQNGRGPTQPSPTGEAEPGQRHICNLLFYTESSDHDASKMLRQPTSTWHNKKSKNVLQQINREKTKRDDATWLSAA